MIGEPRSVGDHPEREVGWATGPAPAGTDGDRKAAARRQRRSNMRRVRRIRRLVTLGLALAGLTAVPALPAAEEVRIGIVCPLTGPTAKFGQAERNALTMAVEDVNGAGGIKSLGGAKI